MYFREDIESKIFRHEEMNLIPQGCQSTALHAIEDVITDLWKENPNGKLSLLFTDGTTESDAELSTDDYAGIQQEYVSGSTTDATDAYATEYGY